MATYCFRCTHCEMTTELLTADPSAFNKGTPHQLVRDYRAESVGFNAAALANARKREGTEKLFLPSRRDFAGPRDPDGSKGLKEWKDRHAPAPGNKRPLWPD